MLNRLLTTLQLYISSNFRPLDLSLSWVARPTGLKTVLTMSLLSRPGRYSAPTAARAGAGGEEAADGSSSAEDGGAAKELYLLGDSCEGWHRVLTTVQHTVTAILDN